MASGPPDDGSILPEGWTWGDFGHGALDVAGLVLGWGEGADVANAVWYANEAQYLEAGLSLISVVPVVGDVIGKGGKLAGKLDGPALKKLVPLLRKMDFAKALAPFRKKFGSEIVDKMVNALKQWRTKLLDRAHGVQSCPKAALEAAGAKTPFKPKGWVGRAEDSSVGRDIIAHYEGQGLDRERATMYAQELLDSGTALPTAIPVQAGDTLYKLSPGAAGDYSPYWMTKRELDNLRGLSDLQIASYLGLPAGSVPTSGFQVSSIVAKEATSIYQSTVAPIAQGAWKAGGGATQTLVPGRKMFEAAKTLGRFGP